MKKRFSKQELEQHYTPTETVICFGKNQANADKPHLYLLVLLKTCQKFGYFPKLDDVTREVINHFISALRVGKADGIKDAGA